MTVSAQQIQAFGVVVTVSAQQIQAFARMMKMSPWRLQAIANARCKERVRKRRLSRVFASLRQRYVRERGDHRRWWIEATLAGKHALLEESKDESFATVAPVEVTS